MIALQIAIPADQYEYLEAKSIALGKSLPELIGNLLTYGRLTPPSINGPRDDVFFLPAGVKRLPAAKGED